VQVLPFTDTGNMAIVFWRQTTGKSECTLSNIPATNIITGILSVIKITPNRRLN
jgi:hypothetical protein